MSQFSAIVSKRAVTFRGRRTLARVHAELRHHFWPAGRPTLQKLEITSEARKLTFPFWFIFTKRFSNWSPISDQVQLYWHSSFPIDQLSVDHDSRSYLSQRCRRNRSWTHSESLSTRICGSRTWGKHFNTSMSVRWLKTCLWPEHTKDENTTTALLTCPKTVDPSNCALSGESTTVISAPTSAELKHKKNNEE